MVAFSLFSIFAAFALLVAATPVNNSPLEPPLHVSIAPGKGNAVVNIAITNVGSKDLEILNLGTFLCDSPIEKVTIFRNGVFFVL